MDKVSFKGYRNILQIQQAVEGHPELLKYGLVTQITGKDLAEWKKILAKFPDKTESNCHNFVKLDCIWDLGRTTPSDAFLYVNNKKLEVSNQNSPIFLQTLKFFRQIANAVGNFNRNRTPNPYPYDRNYIEGLKRLLCTKKEDVTIDELKKEYPIRSYSNISEIGKVIVSISNIIDTKFRQISPE